jgi:TonB-dependent siderophore receptor
MRTILETLALARAKRCARRPLVTAAAALAAILAAAGPASAQQTAAAATKDVAKDDPANEEPPRYEESVDVQGELPAVPVWDVAGMKTPLPLQSTPVSVSVVSRKLFESQDAVVMGDALRNAAGVNVQSGFGVFDYFVVRGFDSLSSGLVLTDSVAEPESTFYPLYNLRQVEVLKGPGAFLYGGNPLAGAVQLVRKQPLSARFADLDFSYGKFDTWDGSVDANAARSDGSLAFRFNGLYRDSDGYRDDKPNSLLGVNPALTWRPDADTHLTASFEYVRSRFQPDTGLPLLGTTLAPVPRTTSYQSPFDVSDQDVYRGRVDFEKKLNDHVLLRDRLYYTELDWLSKGTLVVGVVPNAQGSVDVARSLPILDDKQRLFGNQAEAILHFKTGSVRHMALAGVEVSRTGDEFTQDVAFLPNIGLFGPETAREPLVILPGFSTAADARSWVVAPYFVDQISFSDKLQLYAGARLDHLDYADPLTSTSRDTTKASPMGGIVFSPAKDFSLYASAGKAFAPPSSTVVGPREPEESWQVEAGAKKTFLGGKGLATLALYQLERTNIAIPDATGFLREQGDQRSRGVEAELVTDAGNGWFATAAYAYTDAELTRFTEQAILGFDFSTFTPVYGTVDRSGNRSPFAPHNLASLWVIKQLPHGLGLAAGGRYVGKQFIAADNAYAIDDYVVLDAAAFYQKGRVRVSLNLKNLTDAEYEARGFGNASVIPADPFAIYGRIAYSFGKR